jgi:hypothetical protein
MQAGIPLAGHVTASGGLNLVLLRLGASSESPDAAILEDLRRIAVTLNRDPFLGQPVP